MPMNKTSAQRASALELDGAALSRRALLVSVPLLALPALPAFAADGMTVSDPENVFSLIVPKGWEGGSAEIPGGVGTRIVYGWHTPGDQSTSVSVVSSIASVEYPSMGSFGSAYGFALGNVTRLDRRARKRDRQIADLVDFAERGGSYFYEYTLQRPEEGIYRHVYEQVTLKFDGRYNKLWTVTGAYLDENKASAEAAVKDVVNSFKLA